MPRDNFIQNENQPVRLFCETHGSGAPVILLHGLGATTYTWRSLVPALSLWNELFLLDLKGFGRSPKPRDGKYSVHNQADIVYKFILDHDLQHVTLVGNSFGGGVALVVALNLIENSPDWLSSLILIDAAAYKQPLPGFIRVMRTPIVRSILHHFPPAKRQLKSILELAYYDQKKVSESAVEEYSKPLNMPGGKYAILQTAKQIVPPDIAELARRYKNIKVPTLIIWGRHDKIVPLWVAQKLNEDIQNSKLAIIENAGHMPQEETPEEVLPLIEEFLELL